MFLTAAVLKGSSLVPQRGTSALTGVPRDIPAGDRLAAVCAALREEGVDVVTLNLNNDDKAQSDYNQLRRVWNADIDRHVRRTLPLPLPNARYVRLIFPLQTNTNTLLRSPSHTIWFGSIPPFLSHPLIPFPTSPLRLCYAGQHATLQPRSSCAKRITWRLQCGVVGTTLAGLLFETVQCLSI